MTIARAHLVDPAVTRWYHCVTRCVWRAFLLAEGPNDRQVWIENRLREVAQICSILAENDLLRVDYTGRLFRGGKAAISREVAEVLKRLDTTAQTWQARLERLSKGHLLGRFFHRPDRNDVWRKAPERKLDGVAVRYLGEYPEHMVLTL